MRRGLNSVSAAWRAALPVRLLTAVLACILAGSLLAVAPAGADVFGPISLASEGAIPGSADYQQSDYAHDPAISGDGRYVAFDGSFGGVTGVWRRDLATGTVEQVAGGSAELPSISENGRYISFTSSEDLVPEDNAKGPNVWVRDMEPAEGEPEYILASAVNGGSQALRYEYAGAPGSTERGNEEEHYGSLASGRSALSADGRQVAFMTTAVSTLVQDPEEELQEREGKSPPPHTPTLQVAVRDLETQRTTLVSAMDEPGTGTPKLNASGQNEPVPTSAEGYGAIYPGRSSFPGATYAGASISADGTTVAWMGQEIEDQAQVLPAEPYLSPSYSEPLWRRIADGPQAPIRRITGGGDPASPACAQSGETRPVEPLSLSDPCQGPFEQNRHEGTTLGIWTLGTVADYLPRLSANGQIVAFLSNAREIAAGEEFKFAESSDDLYIVNMADGLTRVQALRRLTEIAGGEAGELARGGKIIDLGISPDGSEIAFSTIRTVFPLGSPAFVSAPAGAPGMVELFDIDLLDDTLTRVTHGFEGEAQPSEQPHRETPSGQDPYTEQDGTFSPSFTTNGQTLAFSSTASNLVYGDGNSPGTGQQAPFDGSDAFVVSRVLFGSTPAPQFVSSAPGPSITPVWTLGVTAISRANGSVLLYVQAPGSGALRAGAQSAVVTRSALPARTGRRARRSSVSRQRLGGTVATRTVATRETDAQGAGLQTLTLALAARYRSLARQRGGLSGKVTVTFTAHGHPTLRKSILVTFLRRVKLSKGRR